MSFLRKINNVVIKTSFLCFYILIPFLDFGQNFDWAKSMGGINNDSGFSTTVDHLGNVYTTGYYEESGDFDPGSSVTTLTSNGNYDVFIQKLNPFGDLLWARSVGGPSFDCGYSVDVDENQNVYITGSFRTGPADFDPGIDSLMITMSGNDIFILKLDVNGNLDWVKTIGGNLTDIGESIQVIENNIYVTGSFSSSVDFDPGIDEYLLSSSGSTNKSIFVLKLDLDGNFNWARKFGGAGDGQGFSIAADSAGNCYTTGSFSGTIDFDPGIGTNYITSAGMDDVFISKLDINGDFVWAKSFTGTRNDVSNTIKLDHWGNLFISGYFHNTTDFNPGPSTNALSSEGYSDIFVTKLDQNGDYIWAKRVGSIFGDLSYGMDLDDSTNVYITGSFKGQVDFDPSALTSIVTSTPYYGNTYLSDDIFVLKLNQHGEFIFVRTIEGEAGDYGKSIAVSGRGDITLTGSYSGTADFKPGLGVRNLTAASGSNDIFVLQLTCNSTAIDSITACDSFTWIDGITYTSDNHVASVIIPNATGCDSTVYLVLDILQTKFRTDSVTACNSYTWIDGNTYTSSVDTVVFNIQNTIGCDSVITLNLTIIESDTIVATITACDSIIWIDGNTYYTDNSTAMHILTNNNGCDSIIKLNLTIIQSSTLNQTITACDSLVWINGTTYYSSTHDTYLLVNSVGCDSLITLDLTIGTTDNITDDVTACDIYTWIDGTTYYSSNNTSTKVLQNITGCDSIITLNLTMNYSNTGIDVRTECDSLLWIDGNTYTSSNSTAIHIIQNATGCDSLVTLNLTMNNSSSSDTTAVACKSFDWYGINYTTSGTPSRVLTNSAGCDSSITLNLTIKSVDATVTTTTLILNANATNAAYQWIDCSDNSEIVGETNAMFEPINHGLYAVEVTQNGCIDTSACIEIQTLSLEENKLYDYNVYPNPTNGEIAISGIDLNTTIEIYNSVGELLKSITSTGSTTMVTISEYSLGVYYVKLKNSSTEITQKLVKY